MIRRNGTGRLSRQTEEYRREDVNPMNGLANLADAMLVLAVGIMIAVVMGWNLDLKKMDSNADIQSISSDEIETVDEDALDVGESVLEELGTLLYDKDSGTYYILSKPEE